MTSYSETTHVGTSPQDCNEDFNRIKLLKGGLAAWKAKGYPVDPYNEVFHLYSPSLAHARGK